jgi:hypothetical protein
MIIGLCSTASAQEALFCCHQQGWHAPVLPAMRRVSSRVMPIALAVFRLSPVELGRVLHWHVARLGALDDAIDIGSRAAAH